MSACTYNLTNSHYALPSVNTAALARNARNVGLFLLAPVIGLAYLITFPAVGLGMLLWAAAKAAISSEKTRPVAYAVAAPVVAIAFVAVGPVLALAALAAVGAKRLLQA